MNSAASATLEEGEAEAGVEVEVEVEEIGKGDMKVSLFEGGADVSSVFDVRLIYVPFVASLMGTRIPSGISCGPQHEHAKESLWITCKGLVILSWLSFLASILYCSCLVQDKGCTCFAQHDILDFLQDERGTCLTGGNLLIINLKALSPIMDQLWCTGCGIGSPGSKVVTKERWRDQAPAISLM